MTQVPGEYRPNPATRKSFPMLRSPAGGQAEVQINGLDMQIRSGLEGVAEKLAALEGEELEHYKRFLWYVGVRSRCPDAHGYIMASNKGRTLKVVTNGHQDQGLRYDYLPEESWPETYADPAEEADLGWYFYDPDYRREWIGDPAVFLTEDQDGGCIKTGRGPGWYEAEKYIPEADREPPVHGRFLCYLASRPLPIGGASVINQKIEIPEILRGWAEKRGYNGQRRSSLQLYVVPEDRGPIPDNGPPWCVCVLYGHAAARALAAIQ